MDTLKTLEELHQEFSESRKIFNQLEEEQVTHLRKLMEENRPVLEWFTNKGYRFSHPIVEATSTKGPILHKVDEYIYVWTLGEGVVKYNSITQETENSNLYKVVRDGGFVNSIQGLSYSLLALKNYVTEIQDEIKHKQQLLDSVKNY